MKPLHAQLVDTFQGGRRQVMFSCDHGTVTRIGKEGAVELTYKPGDALLADGDGNVICGPFSLEGAIDLAESILEGNERAITDPHAIHVLATALIAFQVELPAAPEPEPTALEMAVAHA